MQQSAERGSEFWSIRSVTSVETIAYVGSFSLHQPGLAQPACLKKAPKHTNMPLSPFSSELPAIDHHILGIDLSLIADLESMQS